MRTDQQKLKRRYGSDMMRLDYLKVKKPKMLLNLYHYDENDLIIEDELLLILLLLIRIEMNLKCQQNLMSFELLRIGIL
jgi:hypothetical protein